MVKIEVKETKKSIDLDFEAKSATVEELVCIVSKVIEVLRKNGLGDNELNILLELAKSDKLEKVGD